MIADPNDPTETAFYVARMSDEHEMRASFARVYQLREQAGRADSYAEFEEFTTCADVIERPWVQGVDEPRYRKWMFLHNAASAWRWWPAEMADRLERMRDNILDFGFLIEGDRPIYTRHATVTSNQYDSMLQARDLTQHGPWAAVAWSGREVEPAGMCCGIQMSVRMFGPLGFPGPVLCCHECFNWHPYDPRTRGVQG